MIFVDGLPFPVLHFDLPSEGDRLLKSLLEHPSLVSSSDRLKSIPEKSISLLSEDRNAESSAPSDKLVYVFQREYATVDPGLVQVHLVGGFEDATGSNFSENNETGHSFPLCLKIIEALQIKRERFHIKTLCVLGHNTRRDLYGNAFPMIRGILVNTSSGLIMSASFHESLRGPDEIVRRVRVTTSSGDPRWKGKLMDTYDTSSDRFLIAPCSWPFKWAHVAFKLLQLSDSEILSQCSTSPLAESPDFVGNERRVFKYLMENVDWRLTFPKRRPRIFERAPDGGWRMCS